MGAATMRSAASLVIHELHVQVGVVWIPSGFITDIVSVANLVRSVFSCVIRNINLYFHVCSLVWISRLYKFYIVVSLRGGSRIPSRWRGANPGGREGWGQQHTILQNVPKNCIELRKFLAVAERAPGSPPRSSNTFFNCLLVCDKAFDWIRGNIYLRNLACWHPIPSYPWWHWHVFGATQMPCSHLKTSHTAAKDMQDVDCICDKNI